MFSDGFKSYHTMFSYFTITDAKNETISLRNGGNWCYFPFLLFSPRLLFSPPYKRGKWKLSRLVIFSLFVVFPAPAMFSWWAQSHHLCIKRRGNIFESGRHRFSLWRMHPTLWELLSEERSGNRTWKCKITLCQVLGSTYFYFWQNLHQISNLSNKYEIEDTKYQNIKFQLLNSKYKTWELQNYSVPLYLVLLFANLFFQYQLLLNYSCSRMVSNPTTLCSLILL